MRKDNSRLSLEEALLWIKFFKDLMMDLFITSTQIFASDAN